MCLISNMQDLDERFQTSQPYSLHLCSRPEEPTRGHFAAIAPLCCDAQAACLEREIVTMKLISHPNVSGLLDVWESSREMSVFSASRFNGRTDSRVPASS